MSKPEQDPTIKVKVNGHPLKMMVDSGAAFTCVQPQDATHLPMSGQHVRMLGLGLGSGLKELNN